MANRKKHRNPKEILHDIYTDLFLLSTPSADFDELVSNADILPNGQKDIHYERYTIEEDAFDSIVNMHISNYKLSKSEIESIKFNVYLGCSPNINYKKKK